MREHSKPDLSQLATTVRQYHNCGYAWPIDIMSAVEADSHHQRLLKFEATHGAMHYRVKPYLIFSSAWEIATHPSMLDAVEAILGPDILLWDSSYVIKEPRSDGFISWHQDMTYWGLESDTDEDLVSAWVALTPARKSNGCMRFVSGSHKGKKYRHDDTYDENNLLHRGQTIQTGFSESDISHLEMDAGQASLHHGWAVHSSNPNPSDVRRVALVMNFVKPSVRQTVTDSESATLVRGEDQFGHFAQEPPCGQDNAAENLTFQLQAQKSKREVYNNA